MHIFLVTLVDMNQLLSPSNMQENETQLRKYSLKLTI